MLAEILENPENSYTIDDVRAPLIVFQILHNKSLDKQQKNYDHIQHIVLLEVRPTTKQGDLENEMRKHLPTGVGNFSIFIVHTANEKGEEGHWNAMVARSVEGKIKVQYNDSNGGQIPSVLTDTLKSIKNDINVVDHKIKHEGGKNACGLWIIRDITKLVWKFNEPIQKNHIHDPEHLQLLKIFHKLYGFILLGQEDIEPNETLLNMFKALNTMDSSEQNKKLVEINVKALHLHLKATTDTDDYRERILKECEEKLEEHNKDTEEHYIKFFDDHLKPMEGYKIPILSTFHESAGGGSAVSKIPSTPTHHEERGSEEFKDSTQKPQLLKYNLGDGYEINIYQDKDPYLVSPDQKEYSMISEEKMEETIAQTFIDPDGQTRIRVSWIAGKPHLDQPEEKDYVMVEPAGVNYETDH